MPIELLASALPFWFGLHHVAVSGCQGLSNDFGIDVFDFEGGPAVLSPLIWYGINVLVECTEIVLRVGGEHDVHTGSRLEHRGEDALARYFECRAFEMRMLLGRGEGEREFSECGGRHSVR